MGTIARFTAFGIMALVCAYYYWDVRAAGENFAWKYDLDGYYDLAGRAFASGHLYLPVTPDPKLLALPNPWDPSVDPSLRLQDTALFRGRYYMYHGAAPAILLFTPWRLITGHDLSENFALFLLCAGGYLFACGALWRLLRIADGVPSAPLLGVLLLALGICQGVPFLLNRALAYEIAIGGGYFCVSGGLFFLVRAIGSLRSSYWLAASGVMFGFAIGCRPQLGVVGVIALVGLVIVAGRPAKSGLQAGLPAPPWIAFAAGFGLLCLVNAAYNYGRFGNPIEFGFHYQLAGPGQTRLDFGPRNVPIGLYFMLLCPPDFGRVFPWVRMVFRYPFNSPAYGFPPHFFIEPTVGALWAAPFLLAVWMVPSARRVKAREVRAVLWIVAASAAAILIFLMSIHLQSERYEIDFLPLAVFGALANIAIRGQAKATAPRIVLAILVAYSAVVNLALGLAGPYNYMLKNRPVNYMRIVRWFSPVREFRPILNPHIAADFTAQFATPPDGVHEPLVTIGQQTFRDFVYVEYRPGALRIISEAEGSNATYDMPRPTGPVHMRVAYSPGSANLTVAVDGRDVLVHHAGPVYAAPAQVTIGENRVDPSVTIPKFSGRIEVQRKLVEE